MNYNLLVLPTNEQVMFFQPLSQICFIEVLWRGMPEAVILTPANARKEIFLIKRYTYNQFKSHWYTQVVALERSIQVL